MNVLRPVLAVLSAAAIHAAAPSAQASESESLARALLTSSRIEFLDYQISGRKDRATALDNILQTVNGTAVRRSYYGRAPGGTTSLDSRMHRALYSLAREGYSFRITSLAGGSHCSTSRHYDGLAFDIDKLNGRKIGTSHPLYQRFLARCRELGATQVFGPGTRGHSRHLHIAWSRTGKKK